MIDVTRMGTISASPKLRIFSEKQSCSKNAPYCPLHSCKKLGRSLETFRSKVQRSKKTPFLDTKSPIIRDDEFFGKQSCSNIGPYCPLHSCKKLGRSLEPFRSKVQRSKKKTPFLDTQSPIILD